MQMTGYELLANYEKAEDKDKQIQILADLNHIPVDMVCFVIDKEYGYCEPDVVDDEIEITAWMPLPESYRESEPHKQTNADEIRSMTDEELAEFIINFDNHFGDEYEGEQSCLSWLQKESEEQ